MFRQLFLALGFLALTLGPLARPSIGADEKPHAERADAKGNPVAEEGHEAVPESPMKPEPSLAIWSAVVFLILAAVLYKLAWKPILAAMHEREEHLEEGFKASEHARAESERLLAEHKRVMDQAADQVRTLIEQGRRDAEASAAEIIRKAQAEAEAAQTRAQREIGTARDQALQEIWTRTADLAVSVAGRVLSKDLSGDDHRRLVDSALNELPATQVASTNGHGGVRA